MDCGLVTFLSAALVALSLWRVATAVERFGETILEAVMLFVDDDDDSEAWRNG